MTGARLGALRLHRHDTLPAPGARAAVARLATPAHLVHASLSFSLLDRWLAAGAGQSGRPAVATWHAPFDGGPALAARLGRLWHLLYGQAVLRHFRRVIVFGTAHADWMVARAILRPEQAVVLPNGVETTFWQPAGAARPTAGGHALFVGRLDSDKRPDLLCHAWAAAAPPGWTLRLVGDGAQAGALRRRWGADPRFAFVGPLADRAALRAELQAATLFVLPSPREGQSLAVLEAMACGCAVVTTAAGSTAAALGTAGLVLSPTTDAATLAAALAALLADPARCQALGAQARARAVANHERDDGISRLETLYREIVPHRHAAPL